MENSKLYVGNLPYNLTSEDLATAFGEHGTVKSANIIEGRGFGFVEMENGEQAITAREKMNGAEMSGRNIRVDEARPPKKT